MSVSPALALITPSYEADFERCRLLCESVDAFAEGDVRHYILVADHDEPLFRSLGGGRRRVIPDSAMLPSWMRALPRPFSGGRRHVWISLSPRRLIRPLSGWHVQQLRKLAVATLIDEPVMAMADSDSLFVRPFGAGAFLKGADVRLYRKPGGVTADMAQHVRWTKLAAARLGLPAPSFPADDFINNLVSWRRDRTLALRSAIEERSGLPVEQALGRDPSLSEYQLYGAYVCGRAGMTGHFASAEALSHTYWSGEAMDAAAVARFVDGLAPHQIALCVQSFTQTPVERLRAVLSARLKAADFDR